jgi:hypothetical protein
MCELWEKIRESTQNLLKTFTRIGKITMKGDFHNE